MSFRSSWLISVEGSDSLTLRDPHSLVPDVENQELTKPVSIEEIKRALWAMAVDKAPGLDDFSLFFSGDIVLLSKWR